MFVLLYGLNAQIIYLKTGKFLIILQKPGCIYHKMILKIWKISD